MRRKRKVIISRAGMDVLVVADAKAMRALILEKVGSLGYSCKLACGSEGAMNFLRRDQGVNVTLVIISLRASFRDGEDLIEWVKRNRKGVSVVFVSSATHGDAENSRKLAEYAGAAEVVHETKIIDLPAILHSIIGPARPFD